MKTTRNYHIIYTLEEPTDHTIEHFERDVWFSTDEDNYGNGTYLWWGRDQGYDLRYDTGYNPKYEIGYLADFMARRWSGERGAWLLVSVTITRQSEEVDNE